MTGGGHEGCPHLQIICKIGLPFSKISSNSLIIISPNYLKQWKKNRNLPTYRTGQFFFCLSVCLDVSNLLYLVVCSRLVIVCVYSSIRVITAPTVNGKSGRRERENERARDDRPCVAHTILLTLSWCHVGWRPLHHIHAQMLEER